MSFRGKTGTYCRVNELFLIGEQIRQELHAAGMVKDRKYHLRTYKSCFVGKDIIGWLVTSKHCESREKAIEGLHVLQQYSFLHHVCDDHDIKDEALFYRFRYDDRTYEDYKDLELFYKAKQLYERLSSRKTGMIKSYQQDGELYRNAFQGSVFVDHLIRNGSFYNREDAMLFGRRLLENDTIKHVSDDYHFRDDSRLLYQFTLDFTKQRVLSDVFHFVPKNHNDRLSAVHRTHLQTEKEPVAFHTPACTPELDRRKRTSSGSLTSTTPSESGHCDNHLNPDDERCRSLSADSGTSSDNTEASAEHNTTRSVLIRHATSEELESPDTPYIRTNIKIRSDPVGYGFVIRGEIHPMYKP